MQGMYWTDNGTNEKPIIQIYTASEPLYKYKYTPRVNHYSRTSGPPGARQAAPAACPDLVDVDRSGPGSGHTELQWQELACSLPVAPPQNATTGFACAIYSVATYDREILSFLFVFFFWKLLIFIFVYFQYKTPKSEEKHEFGCR